MPALWRQTLLTIAVSIVAFPLVVALLIASLVGVFSASPRRSAPLPHSSGRVPGPLRAGGGLDSRKGRARDRPVPVPLQLGAACAVHPGRPDAGRHTSDRDQVVRGSAGRWGSPGCRDGTYRGGTALRVRRVTGVCAHQGCQAARPVRRVTYRPWQYLYFRPEPHGQGSFRPTFGTVRFT